MNEPEGPIGEAKNANSALKSFHLFMSEDMITTITTNTNKNINKFINGLSQEMQDEIRNSDKYPYLRETDQIEMEASVGLFYLRGALQGYQMENRSFCCSKGYN